ncbi:MAG TPA: hypothetical protein VGR72_14160, partial [Candidatus Acidoferrales bacterium]|nr:hypothetical protein [Candidatus Acidoferrales bacterium]
IAKNAEEPVVSAGPMDCVVNEVILNGWPFDAHQSPPCPFGVMQFVIAVRLITAVAEARLEKASTINATRPKTHNQYVGLLNFAIPPSTVCIRFYGWLAGNTAPAWPQPEAVDDRIYRGFLHVAACKVVGGVATVFRNSCKYFVGVELLGL